MNQRAPFYVNKFVKGTKPADLPVELPTKISLLVNLKTAKTLGVQVPLSTSHSRRRVDRINPFLLHSMSSLLALSGSLACALHMSAFGSKGDIPRTSTQRGQ